MLASTTTGAIHCFGGDEVANPQRVTLTRKSSAIQHPLAEQIIEETGVKSGIALVLGAGSGKMMKALDIGTDLRIYGVEADAKKVATIRRRFDAAMAYGVRCTVHEGPLTALPHPDHFADLVVLDGEGATMADCSAAELYRVLRPYGGVAWVGSPQGADEAVKWLRNGGVPRSEIRTAKDAAIVRRDELPGAGEWTHQYADAGKSGASTDQVVRMPVKVLWFGEPGPAKMVSRHWKGPAPLCAKGRLFVIGQHSVIAVDAFNGRQLWETDIKSVGRYPVQQKGGSGAVDDDSVYLVAGKSCVRLDAATGETIHTYELPPALEGDDPDALWWDYLAIVDETVLGTMHNADEGRAIFAYSKHDGELKWLYAAQEAIHHDSIAVGDGAVHVIDKTSAAELDQMKRRGERAVSQEQLVTLSLSTGEVGWTTHRGLGKRHDLRLGGGVVLATGGGRMTAYDAGTGKMLSWSGIKMRGFPVIVGGTIYGEPFAYDLRTGEPRTRVHPLTGRSVRWDFRRSYGCGAFSGSPTTLMFRSGTAGFCDVLGDSGTYNFGGVRAGCYVNTIIANGLLLMPPGDAGCTCSYSYQTTVALAPTTTNEQWSVFYGPAIPEDQGIVRLALNLGAPGDRRDANDGLWLASPRPAGIKVPAEVTASPEGGYYRTNAESRPVDGTDAPWLYTSGLEGPQTVTVKLGPSGPESYTVSLHFAELDDLEPGDRVFDVKVQGEVALRNVDVVKEAGGRNTALERTVSEASAGETLTLEFVAKTKALPILSAIEVRKE